MKKVKSTTKNVSIEAVDIEKIRRFTETEFSKLNNSELPFCYQVGKNILVGASKVVYIDDNCWRVVQSNVEVFDFFTRKDAIFYCIATHRNQHDLAENIKKNDRLLNNLEFDAIIYRQRYKTSLEKHDEWKVEYYTSRYLETMDKIAVVKKELKKSLEMAKYIKM